jgi:beta-fructofuranosidase
MKTWKSLGIVLDPELGDTWESGRMCAGCAYKEDGFYYLFYSAAGKGDGENMNEGIGLMTSLDGLNWQRYSNKPFLKPDIITTGMTTMRTLFIFNGAILIYLEIPRMGEYYIFVCACSKKQNLKNFGDVLV